ncbi:MAG: excinuclease ABC subunit A, partial [Actinomycetia bacterium]|nr:excinuclease ABC subunit A [Actinomycetes bacterium]
KLIKVLSGLVDKGNSVIVIEHNLDVIKTADWVIDMGPEGGSGGGLVVAEGTPEQIAGIPASHTGKFLRDILSPDAVSDAAVPAPRKRATSGGAAKAASGTGTKSGTAKSGAAAKKAAPRKRAAGRA